MPAPGAALRCLRLAYVASPVDVTFGVIWANQKSARRRSPAVYCSSEMSGFPSLSRRRRSQDKGLSASLIAGADDEGRVGFVAFSAVGSLSVARKAAMPLAVGPR